MYTVLSIRYQLHPAPIPVHSNICSIQLLPNFKFIKIKSKKRIRKENKSPKRFPEQPDKWYIHNHWPRQEIVDVYLFRKVSDRPIRQFQQGLQAHQEVDESQNWLYPPRCVGQWCFPCDRPRERRLQGTYRRRWRYCDDISFSVVNGSYENTGDIQSEEDESLIGPLALAAEACGDSEVAPSRAVVLCGENKGSQPARMDVRDFDVDNMVESSHTGRRRRRRWRARICPTTRARMAKWKPGGRRRLRGQPELAVRIYDSVMIG